MTQLDAVVAGELGITCLTNAASNQSCTLTNSWAIPVENPRKYCVCRRPRLTPPATAPIITTLGVIGQSPCSCAATDATCLA